MTGRQGRDVLLYDVDIKYNKEIGASMPMNRAGVLDEDYSEWWKV